jgi:hypothetical protein
METVAPSSSYPRFEPRRIKFRVKEQHRHQLAEVLIDKTDKIVDGMVVEFPDSSYPTERYVIERVGQLKDATLLEIPKLQRRFLGVEPGMLGQVCPATEQLRTNLLEYLGQNLLEWCVGARLQPAGQAEVIMQNLAASMAAVAQQEFPEFGGVKLRVSAVWTQPRKFQIEIIADFPAWGGMNPQRMGWRGDLSVPAMPHYDPREGWPNKDQQRDIRNALEPDPKPSPFVDHKPYWKLPP